MSAVRVVSGGWFSGTGSDTNYGIWVDAGESVFNDNVTIDADLLNVTGNATKRWLTAWYN